MGRLKAELLERTELASYRVVDVAEAISAQRRSLRVADQIIGCGTSFGANAYEADEAQSRPEFCRIVGIILRELNESRYWLRLLAARGWLEQERLQPLQQEIDELRRVYGSIVARVRKADSKNNTAAARRRRRMGPMGRGGGDIAPE